MQECIPMVSLASGAAPPSGRQIWLVAIGALACVGCPSPNHYGTPRTVPAGKVAHVFAAEGASYGQSGGLGPSLGIRAGLADRIDFGVRVPMLSALGADIKWNVLRSKEADVALVPHAQYLFASVEPGPNCDTVCGPTGKWLYAYFPVLIGLNADKDFAFIIQTGGAHSWLVGGTEKASDDRPHRHMLLTGIGLGIGASRFVLLQPEVSYLQELTGPARRHAVTFGFGCTVSE